MSKRILEICNEISFLKKALFNLWQSKGKVDREILYLAQQIDSLIIEHDYLLLVKSNQEK